MSTKKIISLLLVGILSIGILAACTPGENQGTEEDAIASGETVNLVSREDASGTRGAFVEIVGVEEEGEDATYLEAVIQNSTNGVLTTVAGDKNSIGYVSLGSVNDMVKAINVDGVEPTAENVQSGDFPIQRPFNIAWQEEQLSDLAQDFLDFLMSKEGQELVEEAGFIQVSNNGTYEGSEQEGSLVIGGSTSVTPAMERVAEAYENLHEGVTVEIHSTGSSAGMTGALDGTLDIGMASRDLSDDEKAELESLVMAIDGIAVITHLDNPIENITLDQVRQVFLGEITTWEEIQ